MVEAAAAYRPNRLGLVERETQELVSEVTTMFVSVLCMRGVLVSERERTAIQRTVNAHITGSVEIQSAIVMNIERGLGPRAA